MPFNKNDKANREDRADRDFKKKPIRRRKKICTLLGIDINENIYKKLIL